MPPDAGEAGHGPKSNTHANCGNYEKHGKSRLWASAPWTVNRLSATTGHQMTEVGEQRGVVAVDEIVRGTRMVRLLSEDREVPKDQGGLSAAPLT
jgi:hypothetical protein